MAQGGNEGSSVEQQSPVTPELKGCVDPSTTLTAHTAHDLYVARGVTPRAVALGEVPSLPASISERYEVLAPLGRGGMGAVYRARDRRLGREVALKLLFDDEEGERLLREARAQARVDHEHACKIFEVGVDGDAGYIAMQYIDGEPLGRAAVRMTLEQKVRVLRQVSLALHEAHRLGLVHRDVKPNNILVECSDNGAFHPFLTDFGIAREAGAQGRTVTGVIAGTPAFMAPEQARGEIHALDRRTDVYGLGATAYVVLAGHPPFKADEPWSLIQRIIIDDAPPIRRIAPEIPADLEAIVARCLEKSPDRRYASARALADDLQRFLDGDPVEARRLSVAYVLLRKARRHRARIAIAGVALVAAFVVAGLWIRDRRLAAQRVELARELGQDAREMETFLERAYVLPLHDVEREREVIRARLRRMEERMAAAGAVGAGPGHYALGRGYLALQEPERAREHLEAARGAGYASPDFDYAMGLALGELYDRALVRARRESDDDLRKARVTAVDAEYAAPASEHLRAALAAPLEAPAYVEGRIELLRGRPEEALAKAKAALQQAPWLYEAKRLEGDAHFAMGSRFRQDAEFDYERMMVDYGAAAEAYRGAAEIARSDPQIHVAECRLRTQILYASTKRRDIQRSSYEQAVAACDRALASSSRSASARFERAFLETTYAWMIVGDGGHADPEPSIDAAIGYAMEAARLAPGEPMAPYLEGLSSETRAYYLNLLGVDNRIWIERAIAAYESALRIDPAFTWAWNDLASTYMFRAMSEHLHGLDPTRSFDLALERSARSAALDPHFANAHAHQVYAYLEKAAYLVEAGRDPAAAVDGARTAISAGRALARDWPDAAWFSAYACWIEASYAVAGGKDPTDALARGDEIAATVPASVSAYDLRGKLAATRARYLLEQGQDPSSAVASARAFLQQALDRKVWDTDALTWRARVEALALRWAARAGEVPRERIATAAAPLLERRATPPALRAMPLADPRPAQVVAELHEIRASSLAARGQSAEEDIAAGLAKADEALELNPRMALALATKGSLLLARARAAKDPRARRKAAQETAEVFSAAIRENPLLGRRLESSQRAAGDLAQP